MLTNILNFFFKNNKAAVKKFRIFLNFTYYHSLIIILYIISFVSRFLFFSFYKSSFFLYFLFIVNTCFLGLLSYLCLHYYLFMFFFLHISGLLFFIVYYCHKFFVFLDGKYYIREQLIAYKFWKGKLFFNYCFYYVKWLYAYCFYIFFVQGYIFKMFFFIIVLSIFLGYFLLFKFFLIIVICFFFIVYNIFFGIYDLKTLLFYFNYIFEQFVVIMNIIMGYSKYFYLYLDIFSAQNNNLTFYYFKIWNFFLFIFSDDFLLSIVGRITKKQEQLCQLNQYLLNNNSLIPSAKITFNHNWRQRLKLWLPYNISAHSSLLEETGNFFIYWNLLQSNAWHSFVFTQYPRELGERFSWSFCPDQILRPFFISDAVERLMVDSPTKELMLNGQYSFNIPFYVDFLHLPGVGMEQRGALGSLIQTVESERDFAKMFNIHMDLVVFMETRLMGYIPLRCGDRTPMLVYWGDYFLGLRRRMFVFFQDGLYAELARDLYLHGIPLRLSWQMHDYNFLAFFKKYRDCYPELEIWMDIRPDITSKMILNSAKKKGFYATYSVLLMNRFTTPMWRNYTPLVALKSGQQIIGHLGWSIKHFGFLDGYTRPLAKIWISSIDPLFPFDTRDFTEAFLFGLEAKIPLIINLAKILYFGSNHPERKEIYSWVYNNIIHPPYSVFRIGLIHATKNMGEEDGIILHYSASCLSGLSHISAINNKMRVTIFERLGHYQQLPELKQYSCNGINITHLPMTVKVQNSLQLSDDLLVLFHDFFEEYFITYINKCWLLWESLLFSHVDYFVALDETIGEDRSKIILRPDIDSKTWKPWRHPKTKRRLYVWTKFWIDEAENLSKYLKKFDNYRISEADPAFCETTNFVQVYSFGFYYLLNCWRTPFLYFVLTIEHFVFQNYIWLVMLSYLYGVHDHLLLYLKYVFFPILLDNLFSTDIEMGYSFGYLSETRIGKFIISWFFWSLTASLDFYIFYLRLFEDYFSFFDCSDFLFKKGIYKNFNFVDNFINLLLWFDIFFTKMPMLLQKNVGSFMYAYVSREIALVNLLFSITQDGNLYSLVVDEEAVEIEIDNSITTHWSSVIFDSPRSVFSGQMFANFIYLPTSNNRFARPSIMGYFDRWHYSNALLQRIPKGLLDVNFINDFRRYLSLLSPLDFMYFYYQTDEALLQWFNDFNSLMVMTKQNVILSQIDILDSNFFDLSEISSYLCQILHFELYGYSALSKGDTSGININNNSKFYNYKINFFLEIRHFTKCLQELEYVVRTDGDWDRMFFNMKTLLPYAFFENFETAVDLIEFIQDASNYNYILYLVVYDLLLKYWTLMIISQLSLNSSFFETGLSVLLCDPERYDMIRLIIIRLVPFDLVLKEIDKLLYLNLLPIRFE